MRPNRLNSRASSATLSLRRQQDVATLFADDSSITQNLLRGQVIPMRRTSIRALPSDPNISLALAGEGPSIADEPSDVVQRPRIRRGLCSSNTWTSSSAEGESENDDLDDRTHFIEEFNRLADKVCKKIDLACRRKLMVNSMAYESLFPVNTRMFL